MSRHEEFEQLCALQAIGQLPPEDHAKLTLHLEDCASCRAALQEFRVVSEIVPAADRARRVASNRILPRSDREFREGFLARARHEGIRLTAQSDRSPETYDGWLALVFRYYPAGVALACLLITADFLLRHDGATPPLPLLVSDPTTAELAREAEILRQELAVEREKRSAAEAESNYLSRQHASTAEKLQLAEAQLTSSRSQSQRIQQDLASAFDARRAADAQAQRLAETARALDQVKAELESVRLGRAADRSDSQALLAAERRRVDDLSEKLRVQIAGSERERELLAAGKDIREIMGARDLHIIDVHDFDVKGKRRKSFGRIFLTEGKSLVFYAFDLADPKLKNAAFQAWGQREANDKQAVDLGIFYADDQSQSRWVLKFNNPDVLREIDSVFVTIEPPGGGRKPTGQKLLYAYLNTAANHP